MVLVNQDSESTLRKLKLKPQDEEKPRWTGATKPAIPEMRWFFVGLFVVLASSAFLLLNHLPAGLVGPPASIPRSLSSVNMDAIQKTIVDPLQPLLRPVVSALPEPVHDAIISLIGSSCHNSLVVDLDVSKDPACTSLAISKALGIAIVGASGIVKVPQILKLIGSRSSAGVSFVSYALETASLLITLSYSVRNQFPFSTFGETALIAVQDVVVGMLVLTFAGRSSAAAAFIAVVAASVYALLFDQTLVDAQTMAMLQAGAGALGVASKAPQIYTIWREGGTGQLSAFAVGAPRYLSVIVY